MYSSNLPAIIHKRMSDEAAAASHESAAQKLLPFADELKRDEALARRYHAQIVSWCELKACMELSSLHLRCITFAQDNGCAMAHRTTSKLPHTFDAVAVRTCSPSHSPAAKKLRVSKCFESANQAARIDSEQPALEHMLQKSQLYRVIITASYKIRVIILTAWLSHSRARRPRAQRA
jgi:hypothetical protein